MGTEAPNNSWLSHPDVPRMVGLAVRRKLRMFDEYHDLDRDSLFADAMGELVKAKYNPAKSKPGTFAYQVAWRRLMDISRRRSKEAEKQATGRDLGEVRRDVSEDVDPEEAVATIYAKVVSLFRERKLPGASRGGQKTYASPAQQMTLYLLQQKMGWSFRQAADAIQDRPDIAAAIGLSSIPSHQFFYRAARSVTDLQNYLSRPHRPAAA